ncbi:MAG: UDP-N-acetylmuramoyl-tripeptide--D-alanyl-D-alanine ligase [Verrucomicrobia bacterium]|nr:UDP-N-acetylmuramoyl-tripeptide--D-alanyl-D-alanine ligase [Verrucomicrobiota bacterium]MCF7708868.1 UDP-N-acetylmuramoyl-tripeptide--D-alanyl-D-alanine ligase [Verrucomicrobiota bacterium]
MNRMEQRTLKFFADACEGELSGADGGVVVDRVCTDSRRIQRGDLFVAIRGENFDGHAFVHECIRKGAVGVVVCSDEEFEAPSEAGIIRVDDTITALGRMASTYRNDFDVRVIAIAGSNGKTTVKELIASVVSRSYPVLKSVLSFNNHIGVPVTLLQLEERHEVAVIELGTNHPGELKGLLEIARPEVGVLTGIGREHLEFFEDLDGVAKEEGILAEYLPAGGSLFTSADCRRCIEIAEHSKSLAIMVGMSGSGDWRISGVHTGFDGTEFSLTTGMPVYNRRYRVPMIGGHQALNAAYAVAVGAELGISPDQIQRGLEDCERPPMRMELIECDGVRLLNDAYNANVDSMRAALETLRDMPVSGRRIAVLGEMAELGNTVADAHAEIGGLAGGLGVDVLIAVGDSAHITAEAGRAAGVPLVREFVSPSTAAEFIMHSAAPGDTVLIKASRVLRLERIGEMMGRKGEVAGNR